MFKLILATLVAVLALAVPSSAERVTLVLHDARTQLAVTATLAPTDTPLPLPTSAPVLFVAEPTETPTATPASACAAGYIDPVTGAVSCLPTPTLVPPTATWWPTAYP
jgi:hypothetical protein